MGIDYVQLASSLTGMGVYQARKSVVLILTSNFRAVIGTVILPLTENLEFYDLANEYPPAWSFLEKTFRFFKIEKSVRFDLPFSDCRMLKNVDLGETLQQVFGSHL